MKKVFWFDTETTGVDPSKNCLIQLGYLIEIEGEIVKEGSLLSRPFPDSEIDPKALEVHGKTVQEISSYPLPAKAHSELISVLSEYVNRFNRSDKFIAAGFYVNFDVQMLRSFFSKNSDPYYGSWFSSLCLDVASFAAWRFAQSGTVLSNNKLKTICQCYGIPLCAHDALADIRATRDLFRAFTEPEKLEF